MAPANGNAGKTESDAKDNIFRYGNHRSQGNRNRNGESKAVELNSAGEKHD